jgi:hypothetical protein
MNVWQVMLEIFWFMLLVAWFWLIISIITDIFRDTELSGFAKGVWCLFVILLPWVGVLCYMIARGHGMAERSARQAAANDQQFRSYVRDVAGSGTGVADEIERLSRLRADGTITDQEYELAKQQVLGGSADGTTVRTAAHAS